MDSSRLANRWPFLFLWAVFTTTIWFSQAGKSPTFDEPYHLAIGYDTLIHRVQRYEFNSPPFARMVVAFPLIFNKDVHSPGTPTNQGDLANQFTFHNKISPQEIMKWPKLFALIPAGLLLLGVFCWGKDLHGYAGGLLAAFLLAVDPNILCNSGILTLSATTNAAILWSSYSFYKLTVSTSWRWMVACGCITGLAIGSHFSALFLLPAYLLLVFIYRDRHLFLRFVLLLAISGVTLFAVTGFELISLRDFSLEQAAIQGIPVVEDWPRLAQTPLPFVRYLYGLSLMMKDSIAGRPTFFLGHFLKTGTPYYFPVAFLIKTALPVLILMGAGLVILLRKVVLQKISPLSKVGKPWFVLLFPALLFSLAAFSSRINIGYRHLLPVLPYLYIALGGFARWASGLWKKTVLAVLLIWLAVIPAVMYPDYRAFFNVLGGGPSRGYRYLVDSNLDWGQELINLAKFQKENRTGEMALAYFGTADPAEYGVAYHCIPSTGLLYCPDEPLPDYGWVAISASCLQGFCTQDNPDFYAPFRAMKPVAKLGYAIFIYNLP